MSSLSAESVIRALKLRQVQLFGLEKVIKILKSKPRHAELINTGRYAPQDIIELAGLVTDMKEIKHYFHKGIEARLSMEM